MKYRYLFIGVALASLVSCNSNEKEDKGTKNKIPKMKVAEHPNDLKRVGNGKVGFSFTNLMGDTLFNGRKFYLASEFKNGYAVVTEENDGKQLRGVINYKGEEVIPVKFKEFIGSNNSGGYFSFTRKGEGTGFIDSTGKIIFEPIYKTSRGGIQFNQAILQNQNGLWGSISLTGDTIIDFKYADIGVWHDKRVAVKKQDNKYIFLNTEGNPINENTYDYIMDYEKGIALVKKNGLIGFINKKGETVIDFQFSDYKTIVDLEKNPYDFKFDEKNHRFMLEEGYIIVKKKGKWGYINSKGEEIVPIEFDDIAVIQKGQTNVKVVKNGKQGKYSIKDKKYTERE